MELGLTGKIALVTGGSKGIGKGIARVLSAEGCRVAICSRTRDDIEATAAEITGETGNEVAAFEGAVGHFGGVDILVNNAGAAPGGVIENLTEDDWAESLQLKFMGYVRCTKAVLPHMQRRGHGRIVNLIGNDGIKHSYWEIAPGAANAAGQNFTLSMAGRYGKDGISFVAVNPGPVRTERWDGLVKAMAR
ncbi:MAG: SDR family NAD(P)-dependent oxidoreductase, partial [Nitrospinota bacterium]|nr:SDR family NAD(P)-dependent oxidoreductase [Nitrospinota bacterium]